MGDDPPNPQASDLDMENRDPNSINDHLAVKFEDVIAEPEGTHSIDCVWINSYKCFTKCQACCYNVLTVLCGIIHAICWGCIFACVAFIHIWQITPCFRCLHINMTCFKNLYGLFISCVCDAWWTSVSLVFEPFRRA